MGAMWATPDGTCSPCPQNPPRLFDATEVFQLQAAVQGYAVQGYACHTPSHTRGCAVTHWVAHGVTAHQPCSSRGSASLRAVRSHAHTRARCHMHARLAVPPLRWQRPSCCHTCVVLLLAPRTRRCAFLSSPHPRSPPPPALSLLRRSATRAWRGGGGACILTRARPIVRGGGGPAPPPAELRPRAAEDPAQPSRSRARPAQPGPSWAAAAVRAGAPGGGMRRKTGGAGGAPAGLPRRAGGGGGGCHGNGGPAPGPVPAVPLGKELRGLSPLARGAGGRWLRGGSS